MEINNHTIVTLRFTMWNEAGELMEDNFSAEPFSYVHGSGNLMPALEAKMLGMTAGEAKSFSISDKILQGLFRFDVFVEDIRAATPDEIESGWPSIRKDATDCGPDCNC